MSSIDKLIELMSGLYSVSEDLIDNLNRRRFCDWGEKGSCLRIYLGNSAILVIDRLQPKERFSIYSGDPDTDTPWVTSDSEQAVKSALDDYEHGTPGCNLAPVFVNQENEGATLRKIKPVTSTQDINLAKINKLADHGKKVILPPYVSDSDIPPESLHAVEEDFDPDEECAPDNRIDFGPSY